MPPKSYFGRVKKRVVVRRGKGRWLEGQEWFSTEIREWFGAIPQIVRPQDKEKCSFNLDKGV